MATRKSAGKRGAKTSRKPAGERRKGISGVARASAPMERMKRYIRAHGEAQVMRENVTSIGIAHKRVAGSKTPELCLQFTVGRKLEPQLLQAEDIEKIPSQIVFEGVKIATDVVQRNFSPSYLVMQEAVKASRKQRQDPVAPGLSVANVRSTAGTIGAIVADAATGQPLILSNWHVLAGAEAQIGDAIVQPGPYDDDRTQLNGMGKLLRSHLGIAGDCALASIDGRKFTPKIFDLKAGVRRIGKPELGDLLIKSGRTTGVTYGVVSRIEAVIKIEYPGVGRQMIGGFEIEPSAKHPAPGNEISKGGDSGAAWLAAAEPDVMLGLHFGGDADGTDDEVALACYAHAVFEKLEIKPWADDAAVQTALRQSVGAEEAYRTGFDPEFLSFKVPRPRFSAAVAKTLIGLDGADWIDYCHFSVWLSRTRKLPVCVAWNIDGASKKSLDRKGIPFIKDDREGLDEYQIGDELYSGNPLDRGHVARRDDLVWGDLPEARQANIDSFFFTNMTPQHEAFNQGGLQGKWGQLETAILDNVVLEQLRVSLMGGPVLGKDDPLYRDVQIPREFWKVVFFTDESDGESKARAFLLTQADLLKKLKIQSLELQDFEWYQVPLNTIEQKTGVRFPASVKKFDTKFAQALGTAQARLIKDGDFF